MEELPACYTILFNGVSDALKALEDEDPDLAWTLLQDAQLRAEDAYIEAK